MLAQSLCEIGILQEFFSMPCAESDHAFSDPGVYKRNGSKDKVNHVEKVSHARTIFAYE